MRNCMGVGNVVAGVICADGHLGYAQPVGGVIAYEKQISISGVGFDIGCGNMAVRLDVPYTTIADRVGPILKDVSRVISFGVGRNNQERVEHDLFDDAEAWHESDMGEYRQKAVNQLGTVGSGNHYVDLMRDEAGFVWIGVHFGSRGLGHTSATRYLKTAGGKDGMNVPPAVIDEDSEIGRRYIAAMQPLFLCRPRMGHRAGPQDHRWRRDRHGAQSPQLRMAREPRRPRSLGGAQRRNTGLSGPARLCRRIDGRRRGHHRGVG
jgi:tRNA-splicing ligase RtcB (3'-phosphate/5'-hydroxy nucleic acid ligase)